MKLPPRAASRYASALLSLAREANAVPSVSSDLAGIRSALEQSQDLARFLGNTLLPRNARWKTLQSLFQEKAHPLTWNLLMVLEAKRRLSLLPSICSLFQTLEETSRGIVRGTLTAALPAPAESVAAMADQAGRRLGRTVLLGSRSDPALLGGCRLQVGDNVYDFSLAARLRLARQALAGA